MDCGLQDQHARRCGRRRAPGPGARPLRGTTAALCVGARSRSALRTLFSDAGWVAGNLAVGAPESDIPGVEDLDATAVVVRDVAGGDRRPGGAGDCGDLGVEVRDRAAGAAAVGRDARVSVGRVAAEGEDAAGGVLTEHRFSSTFYV